MEIQNLNRVEYNTKNGQMFYLVNPQVSDEAVCKHAVCIFGGVAPNEITDIDNAIRNRAIDKALVPMQGKDTISITSEKGTNVYQLGKNDMLLLHKQLINKPIAVLEEIKNY